MLRPRLSPLACCLGLALFAAGGPAVAAAARGEITVFAAASLTNALREIGAAYEAGGGGPVVFNFASSATLARQIEEGAPADVFFSADEAKMDGLQARGAVLAGSRRSLLSNALVIVVPKDSPARINGVADLAGAAVRVLALAEPRSTPAGIYAREYLRAAGVWPLVSGKVVPTENVRAALSAVESGNADAAIVYKTDAAISSEVRVAYEVPRADGPRISYPVAVIRHGRDGAGGGAFVTFLESPPALATFRRFGFVVAEPAP